MQLKICSKCSIPKPLNAFAKHNTSLFGVHSTCKKCRSGASKIYRTKIQEELNEKGRKYYHETIKKQHTRAKKYYTKNCEEIQSQRRKYREENSEKVQKWRSEYFKMRRQTDPMFKLNSSMSTVIGQSLKGNKAGRHWESLVGYTLDDLKKHLEKQFIMGMTWNNYGEWHLDHKIPVSIFNFEKSEHGDFKRCWALSNLQPMWAKENWSKGARLMQHFQPSLLI